MTLFALGLNHQTAPLEIRERVAFATHALEGALMPDIAQAELHARIADAGLLQPIEFLQSLHGEVARRHFAVETE